MCFVTSAEISTNTVCVRLSSVLLSLFQLLSILFCVPLTKPTPFSFGSCLPEIKCQGKNMVLAFLFELKNRFCFYFRVKISFLLFFLGQWIRFYRLNRTPIFTKSTSTQRNQFHQFSRLFFGILRAFNRIWAKNF